jgi:Tfp pilus assembly protein PilF
MSKANSRVEAFKYVDRAIRLQLSEDAALAEVEECLNKALKLDPDSVEALQEAAHFYDAVMPNARKARRYAVICREKASKVVGEMEEILAQ